MNAPQPPAGSGAPAREQRAVSDVVREHTRTLGDAGVATPAVDARTLARHALGLDVATLTSATVADVDPVRLDDLAELVARRAERIPLQHLTGETGFRRLTISCRPGVFVPRPETEVLAGEAIERLHDVADPIVAEPCTGTGAVALSIADELPGARVFATDVSEDAIALARHNRSRLGSDGLLRHPERCEFLLGDLFDPLARSLRGRVDAVVCNPPYLTAADVERAEPEVGAHDPREALVAGRGGFAVIDRLLELAPDWLTDDGWILLEVADMRGADTVTRARRAGYRAVSLVDDLAGRSRVLVARPPRTKSSS